MSASLWTQNEIEHFGLKGFGDTRKLNETGGIYFFASMTEFPHPTSLIFETLSSESRIKENSLGKGEPSVLYAITLSLFLLHDHPWGNSNV